MFLMQEKEEEDILIKEAVDIEHRKPLLFKQKVSLSCSDFHLPQHESDIFARKTKCYLDDFVFKNVTFSHANFVPVRDPLHNVLEVVVRLDVLDVPVEVRNHAWVGPFAYLVHPLVFPHVKVEAGVHLAVVASYREQKAASSRMRTV